jgi:hypothetical protein
MIKNPVHFATICKIRYLLPETIKENGYVPNSFQRDVGIILPPAWSTIYFTPGTAEFTEVQKEEDAGPLFMQTLKFLYPGEQSSNLPDFDPLLRRPILVALFYTSGVVKIIGDDGNAAYMTKAFKSTAKEHCFEFTVVCKSVYQAFIYGT